MKIIIYHKDEIVDIIDDVKEIHKKTINNVFYDKGSLGELHDEHYYFIAEDETEVDLITSEERLAQFKELKINQFNEICEEEITKGFYSTALGEEHFYGFDEKDQANFSMQLAFLNIKLDLDSITWKTEDAGVLLHTKEQFLSVCEDAELHKRSMIQHYWTIKAQIESLETFEEINQVGW